MEKTYEVQLEIAGDMAIWTRPDTGDSPVSYPAPTYSAVKGIFESILWGPAVEVVPRKVEICKPIIYHSYATNYGGPLRETSAFKKDHSYQLYATTLIDVCYRLYAHVIPNRNKRNWSKKATAWDQKTTSPGHAYQDIFNRRLERGQCFHTPFLGWKEFTPSYFGVFREETTVCADMEDIYIPSMLRQVFVEGHNSTVDFTFDYDLMISNGVLNYFKSEGDGHD